MPAVFPANRWNHVTKTKLAGTLRAYYVLTVPLGAACSKPVDGRSCRIYWIGLYTRPVRQMLAVSRTAAVSA